MEEKYFLGLDGGQSSTLAVICDQTGRLLGVGHAGPSNHVHEPGGMERLKRALNGSLLGAWQDAGLVSETGRKPHLAAACFGVTGGAEYVADLVSEIAHIDYLVVVHDLVTAHAGALAGGPGVIVIAGTGSVAYGVNPRGESARAGGWAYLIGDEGSGYDIGRQALIAAARVEDGRGPASRLLEDVLAYFKAQAFWDVRELVYSEHFERADVADLSRLVVEAALSGDAVARQILDDAGKSLAEIAAAVLHRLGMDYSAARVCPVGGVFQAGESILEPFSRYLCATAPQSVIASPVYPPVLGAVLMALQSSGAATDEQIRQNLARSAHVLAVK